jgi:hypothetical protein
MEKYKIGTFVIFFKYLGAVAIGAGVRAGVASCYGVGFTKMMRLLAAPAPGAPQHWPRVHNF